MTTRAVGAILDIHRGRRTTNQTRNRRILPRGCPGEADSYGARQSEGDENGIIVPVKWCGLVSLSIKAWCPLSLHSAEKILDRRDLVRKRLNESPLRHQPKKGEPSYSLPSQRHL